MERYRVSRTRPKDRFPWGRPLESIVFALLRGQLSFRVGKNDQVYKRRGVDNVAHCHLVNKLDSLVSDLLLHEPERSGSLAHEAVIWPAAVQKLLQNELNGQAMLLRDKLIRSALPFQGVAENCRDAQR